MRLKHGRVISMYHYKSFLQHKPMEHFPSLFPNHFFTPNLYIVVVLYSFPGSNTIEGKFF